MAANRREIQDWQITCMSFKPSGEWYAGGPTQDYTGTPPVSLLPEHRGLNGFELLDLIKQNDPSTHYYSGIAGGFPKYFTWVIMVQYPDNVQNYCTYMILGRDE